MMNKTKTLLMTALLGCLAGGGLNAATMTLTAGGETDTLSLSLIPLSGARDGVAGAIVGWGYTLDWEAAHNLLFLSSSSVGSETNSSIMMPNSYIDFTGGTVLGSGVTVVPFDNASQGGVGSYQISSDPSFAITAAEDIGSITFSFVVLDSGGNAIPGASYTYSDASTAFSVTVDASDVPEPGTFWLLAAAGILFAVVRAFRSTAAGQSRIRAVI